MTCTCDDQTGQLCGCCAGVSRATPLAIANRPGLPSLPYRVGTWARFLASIQSDLSSSAYPPLAGLRTHETSDFSMALADAWCEVLDILTFYTERLANEAYLATAREGRSVFELARLVGYKASPGVSASTVLAFTLSSAPGSPMSAPIPARTRVQSVPGPGEKAQVFETSADLVATVAANAVPAVTYLPWQLKGSDTFTWITGTANNVRTGDALLFISAPGGIPDPSGAGAVVYVTDVNADASRGKTRLTWNAPLPTELAGSDVRLYIFRTRAALFGASAPWPGILPATTLVNIPGAPSAPSPSADWSWYYGEDESVYLDNVYPGLNPAASGDSAPADQSQWAVLTGPQYTSFFQVKSAADVSPNLYSLSNRCTQVTMNSGKVLAGDQALTLTELLYLFAHETRVTTAYIHSDLLTGADIPITDWDQSTSYPLALGMLAPVSASAITLKGVQTLVANSPVAVSGKRVRIAATADLSSPEGGFTPAGASGMLAVSKDQPFLVDAFPPQTDGATGNFLWTVLTPTGQAGILATPPGEFQLCPSDSKDDAVGEAAIASYAQVQGSTTAITFSDDLARIYDASTVTLNANAVEATHGETVQEILGSGDATNPALQFQLKQAPLTYCSAANADGAQSTLEVRVNNLLWKEVDNFLNTNSSDRVYVTRPSSSSAPIVQFGNGRDAALTPTGQSNIWAQYRKGIGRAGMVAAGQLTQALDRPLGLQGVTNPSPASGGADPATADEARLSAPLPTLTLGRVVSLEDYQNFALNFAGISMALASWAWFGITRGVFLTVAGAGGAVLKSDDAVLLNLQKALTRLGLPNVPVQVVSYTPVLFNVAMQVKVDTPTYVSAQVMSSIWQALQAAFAFGKIKPGQSVAASYVLELAQDIDGVVAVNLVALNRSGDAASVSQILCAAGPQPGNSPPAGAEVLVLDPAAQGNLGVWS